MWLIPVWDPIWEIFDALSLSQVSPYPGFFFLNSWWLRNLERPELTDWFESVGVSLVIERNNLDQKFLKAEVNNIHSAEKTISMYLNNRSPIDKM